MDKEIEAAVKTCNTFQIRRAMPDKAPIHPWKNTTTPQIRNHVDFDGPLFRMMFLIVCDSFSKWIEAIQMKYIKSSAAIICLRETFEIPGILFFTVSDNGPSFSSQNFKRY